MFRLVQIDEREQVAEEAIFSIQGVLSVKNLPPVTEKNKVSKGHTRKG